MRKDLLLIVLAVVLAASLVPSALAADAPPRGSCPPGFELHNVGQHEDHDHHVGLTVDLNRDNKICVKHVSEERHVHMDNVIRD